MWYCFSEIFFSFFSCAIRHLDQVKSRNMAGKTKMKELFCGAFLDFQVLVLSSFLLFALPTLFCGERH